MTEPTPATPRLNYYMAVIAAATGAYIMALGANLLPVPGGPSNLQGPQWLLICAGLTFFLASIAIVIQALGHADDAGELPPAAPRWMSVVQYLIGFAIFACFGAIASWIAFGPGERQFSGTFGFVTTAANETMGRVVFGTGAIMIWLAMAAILASGIRKFSDRNTPNAG